MCLSIRIVVFCAWLMNFNVHAQEFPRHQKDNPIADPLSKPALWSDISQSPENLVLWTMYWGKAWVCMTGKEKTQIAFWKQKFGQKAEKTHSSDESSEFSDDFWADAPEPETSKRQRNEREEMEQAQYLKQLESMMLMEPSALSFLKSNIKANFVVIEDTYNEAFGELGVSYTYYANRYPKGNYSQDLWVREKDAELRALKRKEFEKIKNQLADTKNN